MMDQEFMIEVSIEHGTRTLLETFLPVLPRQGEILDLTERGLGLYWVVRIAHVVTEDGGYARVEVTCA